jgi:hypothetical protein
MPDFLTNAFAMDAAAPPAKILAHLLAALLAGFVIAWIHRRARGDDGANGSFPGTLVLLTVLIALVTQVIGESVARAFSLVGALSIVRFRTVVRDTQDTAYVIFAVVVGMALGSAGGLWPALVGLTVVGAGAWLLRAQQGGGKIAAAGPAWLLTLRLGTGREADALLRAAAGHGLVSWELLSVETARQGAALDHIYDARLRDAAAAPTLTAALNRTEGVQAVTLRRREFSAE